MAKKKKKIVNVRKAPPAGFRENFANFVQGVIAHLWMELGVLALLVVVLVVTFWVVAAVEAGKSEELLNIERVPLTETAASLWMERAKDVGAARAGGKVAYNAATLPAFLEWGRRNADLLAPHLVEMTPAEFLGVAASVLNARKRLSDLVEHDMRFQEEEKAYQASGNANIAFTPTPAPALESWERDDLAVYENYQGLMDTALEALIPGIPLPVASWEDERRRAQAQAPVSADEGGEPAPARKLSWRIISTSRYGPRIIRKH